MKGKFGKILWVDLSKETFREEKLSEKIYRHYIGGYGLGCKLIYDNMIPKSEALGLDSIFGFFPGLLTGTPAPFSGRYMVAGKSPLTGTWGDANGGGTFAPEIKKCGYDAILFKGVANSPKYVKIINDDKEILDASEIWGLDIIQADEKLKDKYGRFIKTAGIGQAGENLSIISGIANDKGRIAARSGIGAIMGSKKLKMLVLKGKEKVEFHDKDLFMNLVRERNSESNKKEPSWIMKKMVKQLPKMAKILRKTGFKTTGKAQPEMLKFVYQTYGTIAFNTISAEIGDSPIKNWGGIGMYDFPISRSTNLGPNLIKEYQVKPYGCITCPIQCGGILKIPDIDLKETHMPEYETCCSFGALLLNNDLMSIFKINEMCNRAAIDTISTGGTVAFAIECFENGILTSKDTDGLELTWGNSDAIIELVKKIIKREGIGDLLADGSKKAAEKIGKDSMKYAMTSLGQEIAMHSPKAYKSLAFSYAYDPTPGKHTTASISFSEMGPVEHFLDGWKLPKGWKEDVKIMYLAQKYISGFTQVLNCAGLCQFSTLFGYYPFLGLINSLTGWNIEVEELIKTGLRIQNLRQAFTLREGVEIADNKLPGRIYGDPPDDKGPKEGISIDYEDFYKGYCGEMGWNIENGYPLIETLQDLDLDFVIKDLY